MCLTSSMPAAANCSLAGGLLRVLVAKASALLPTHLTVTTTGATRHQITAIDVTLPWYELKFDRNKDASALTENTVAGAAAYSHTVNVLTSTDDFATQTALAELQDCCGYIALVKFPSGNWAMLGLNYSKSDGSYDAADMKVKYDFNSGANRTDTAAGGTVAIASENVNYTWLPVAPAAAAAAITAIVAHTP